MYYYKIRVMRGEGEAKPKAELGPGEGGRAQTWDCYEGLPEFCSMTMLQCGPAHRSLLVLCNLLS